MSDFETQFNKEVVHYEEHEDSVDVVVKDLVTGEFKKYKTRYFVACDGNRSATRKKEGIIMKGRGVLGTGVSIRFKGDLQKLLGDRAKHAIIYVRTPRIQAAFRQEEKGKAGLPWLHKVDGKTDFAPGSITEEEARSYLHECAGIEDDGSLELASFAHWTLASCVADGFSSTGGRILIAGDAAHIMPPTGALGGNTGCNDAHNLAWKLAYVVSGKASPSLLESYEQERKPVDGFVVDQATRRLENRILGKVPLSPEELYYVVEFGHRYNNGAIIPVGSDSHDKDFEDPHVPSGTAGSRFPHVWLLANDGSSISSLDLIRQNFVLFATEKNSFWISTAKAFSLPIDSYSLHEHSQPYVDSFGRLRSKAALGQGEALLVRPDGFVAWRAENLHSGHEEALRSVLQQILGQVIC